MPMHSLDRIQFQNEFVDRFPGDQTGNKRPRQTPGMLYSRVQPTPVPKVELLAWSDALAAELEIEKPSSQAIVDILGGNSVTPTMKPYAACYAGHQFGNWAGQLGDGRAITLGEMAGAGGSWELQLKGPGQTPYSRRADGRAVLRSSVREYLMSEAMHALGVPTTRALSLVSTGEPVLRDMFYDGHPAHEPGAIVMRVAPSFLRFGSFEMPAARNEIDNLRTLVNWTIDRYYPHLPTGPDRILAWFAEVAEKTAFLMAEWMRVGFVHGVMNTDNMSILGLTIDYGPYSFLDDYDPDFTPNTTDLPGKRYAFGRQPSIAYWNLGCLGGALAPLLPDTKELVAILDKYESVYLQKHFAMMERKLGLDSLRPEDRALVASGEKILFTAKPDMTIFYQLLAGLPDAGDAESIIRYFEPAWYVAPSGSDADAFVAFINQYRERIASNAISPGERVQKMGAANPRFILRNYMLHNAIEELQDGEPGLFRQLETALLNPYQPEDDRFFVRRPDWAGQKAGCSMLSCSS
ncbi:MAG: hypothetical protein JWP27_1659 [Flaviaesturariibacter sp.]|nr:hypothetical protein [Flaviaesturariibacter sp.]